MPPENSSNSAAHDGLDGGEHVLLLHEAHLQVELVELAGRAVGARVLVAEAGRDLEVAVEARDHGQLLELLRRLRQGVELAGVHARGHEKVARALRRGGGEDRRLELEEAGLVHAPADRGDDGVAQDDVPVQRLAAQVEEAVLQPEVLGVVRLAEHRNRQLLGRREHLDLAGEHLHLARRQLRVERTLGTLAHLAVDADHPLGAHRLGGLEGGAVGVRYNLSEAVVVAQVDEQQAAVIAHAMHPAGQPDRCAYIAFAQRPAGVRAIAVHRCERRLLSFAHGLAVNQFFSSNRGRAHGVQAMSRLRGPWPTSARSQVA